MQKEPRKMTPLEALDSIIDTFYNKNSEDIKIVRKSLKAIELLKKVITIKIDLRDPTQASFIQIRDNLDRQLVVYQTIDYNKAKILKEIFE